MTSNGFTAADRPEREGARGARGRRPGRRLLAQLDARQARRVARRARRVLADGHGQRRVERCCCWSTGRRVTMRDVRQALVPGRLLRAEPGRVLRRGDAQQRRQRRADRLARAVPDRAGRRLAVQRVHRSARAGVRARSRSAASRSCCSARRPTATRRWRATCSACSRCCCWSAYVASTKHFRQDMDVTTFMATICPIAARGGASAGDRPRRRVRDERHGLDVHADPHLHQRGRRPGAAGVRAEDDPDRHDRDRPGGAARARGRVVVPAAGRGGQSAGRWPASRSSSAGCWRSSC